MWPDGRRGAERARSVAPVAGVSARVRRLRCEGRGAGGRRAPGRGCPPRWPGLRRCRRRGRLPPGVLATGGNPQHRYRPWGRSGREHERASGGRGTAFHDRGVPQLPPEPHHDGRHFARPGLLRANAGDSARGRFPRARRAQPGLGRVGGRGRTGRRDPGGMRPGRRRYGNGDRDSCSRDSGRGTPTGRATRGGSRRRPARRTAGLTS